MPMAYILEMQNIENDGFWMDGFPPIPAPENLFEDTSFDNEKIIRECLLNQPFRIFKATPIVYVVSYLHYTMPITFYYLDSVNYVSFELENELMGEIEEEIEFTPFYTARNLQFILFTNTRHNDLLDYTHELQNRLRKYDAEMRQGKLDILLDNI